VTLVKGSIGLGIRERQPQTKMSSYSSDAIEQWIEDLPMANIGETSRRVYHRLLESNTSLLDVKVRTRLLNSLNKPIKFICNYLTRYYTVQSASLTEKQMKVANLSRTIQLEAAIGYKTIIEDLIVDEKYGSKLLPIAVNHALYYLYKVQVLCAQLYSDLPKGLWREIHLLYRLAEQNQFHEPLFTVGNEQHSISNTYKRIILLSTANTNQLRQRDIDLLAVALPTVAKNCTINTDPDAVFDFVSNLNSDAPPFHRALLVDGMKAHYRGFDVNNITVFLQQELKTTEKQRRKIKLDDALIRHLIRVWGTMATRTFTRTATNDVVKLSMGLAASHYLISKETSSIHYQEEDQELRGEALVESLEGSLRNATILSDKESEMYQGPKTRHSDRNIDYNNPVSKSDTMWDSVYRKKSSLDMDDDGKPYRFMEKSAENKIAQYDYQDATIINISPNGYCMRLTGTMPKQTQTGEIIGLLEHTKDNNPSWNIGHICWVKRHESGELHMGVNLLAPNAEPVFAQISTSTDGEHQYQRCLLLPAMANVGQSETILTSTIGFTANQEVCIKDTSGNEFDVKFTNLISSGHSFLQFSYEVLHTEIPEKTEPEANDDFDSVWDML